MSRGGRLAAALVAAGLVATGLAGCGLVADRAVQAAAPAHAPDCVVGSWKQSEGWQRIVTEDVAIDLYLITGGRLFDVKADGTGRYQYADPTKWTTAGSGDDYLAVYTGEATLKYTVADGTWSDTTDASKTATQLTLNDTKDPVVPGAASRSTKATFVCDATDFIITGDTFRHAFKRV